MNDLVTVEALRAHDNEYRLVGGAEKPGKEPGDAYQAPAGAAAQLKAQGLVKTPGPAAKAKG